MRAVHVRIVFLAAFAAIVLTAPLAAQQAITYQVGPTDGHVSFIVTKWMVFKEEGKFKDVRGTIVFDRRNPTASRIDLTVQTASLDTNEPVRDQVVRSEDFLDVARYPTMTFVSVAVKPTGEDSFDVTGDLTIHGVTKRITVPVKLLGVRSEQGVGDLIGFETSFTVNRTEYGVLGTRWSGGRAIISHEVQIHMRIGGMNRRR